MIMAGGIRIVKSKYSTEFCASILNKAACSGLGCAVNVRCPPRQLGWLGHSKDDS
jgi:hypothetical protein